MRAAIVAHFYIDGCCARDKLTHMLPSKQKDREVQCAGCVIDPRHNGGLHYEVPFKSTLHSHMIELNRYPSADVLDAFQDFLCNALSARQQEDQRACDIWMQAANRLFPVDGTSISALLTQLAGERRNAEAEAIARALARLEPRNATAHFNLGLALQFANRHADAIAPYRDALAIQPKLHSLRNNLAAALLDSDPASPRQLSYWNPRSSTTRTMRTAGSIYRRCASQGSISTARSKPVNVR